MSIENQQGEQKTEGILIPFSDDDVVKEGGDNDPDPNESGITEDVRKERNRRRGERIGARLRAGEEAQALATTLQQENRQLADRLARLEGAHVQLASQRQGPPVDPYETKLQEIESRRDVQISAMEAEIKTGRYTEERQKHYKQVGEQLDRERVDTMVERRMAAHQPQVAAHVQTTVAQNQWRMQYPEIYSNPRAEAWASARRQQLLAEGKPDSVETIHEAIGDAKRHFKLGAQPRESSPSERSRLSGHPATGGSANAGPKKGDGIVMTRELQRIARAAYSHLKPEEADKKWAQTTGKKMREKGEL